MPSKKPIPEKPVKKKTGRPSKFDGIDMKQVEALAKRGWTDAEMAGFFRVAKSTWHLWKTEHPEFSDSLKDWKPEADARVELSLYERAIGYKHVETKFFVIDGEIIKERAARIYPPDTTACIFWLKNRKSKEWRDQPDPSDGDEKPEVVIVP